MGPNRKVSGTYDYTPRPDGIPETKDPSPEGWDITSGNLFNRPASLKADPVRSMEDTALRPWVVSWKTRDPVILRIKFGETVRVRELRLWIHGEAPDIEIGVADSGTYKPLASINALGETDRDVREVRLSFAPAEGRVFEVRFGPRQRREMILSEVELWSNDSGH